MTADNRDVAIREPISTGLAEFDTATSDLAARYPDLARRIRALNSERPWGTGPEGAAFANRYFENGGPTDFLDKLDDLVTEIAKSGPLLRKGVANTLATDAAIAQSLQNPRGQA
ncbi:hypothetical protein [Nonomuraea typhae]|uniref:hypothetical protein n=1 Tax=Nonomuraea typhae TaxID=2603600 RepID=UPI0012FA4E03|nr:hypothetical protein [Nonomuraea typhae]